MMQTEVDVLIIGAGPAGSTAAAILQREGFRLLVVEKQEFPRFVIGESMLPHSMDILQEAGLLECVEKLGFIKKFGAVFLQGDETCNFDFSSQFTPGYKYTYQVTRADFDKALADEVASRGVPFLYRHGVTAVDFATDKATVTLQQPGGSERVVTAKFVMDCSGYGRVLPRLLDLEKPSKFPVREALFTHVTGDARPEGREEGKIWVTIHPGGAWIWIIPFASGKTSVGVVGDPEFFKQYPGEPEAQLRAILMSEPNAAARLGNTKSVFPPMRINGFSCAVKNIHGPRYALVGNATEFLDPIFSSGVMLALSSASRSAKIVARELRGEKVDWNAEYVEPVMAGMSTFRAFVSAWYDGVLRDILFSVGKDREIMGQVCSVLAGYVWDKKNPYATQAERALPLLLRVIQNRAKLVAK